MPQLASCLTIALLVSCGISLPATWHAVFAQEQPAPPAPGVANDRRLAGVFSPDRVAADRDGFAKKQQAPLPRGQSFYFPWNSLSPAEFEALGRRTLLLVAVWTQKPEELPVKRVYLRADGREQPLYKVSGWRTPVDSGSLTAKMYGANREDGFYLLAGGAMLQKGQLLQDLTVNVTGWVMLNFPSNVASSDAKRFPNLDPVSEGKPDLKTPQAVIQQRFTGFPVPQSLP